MIDSSNNTIDLIGIVLYIGSVVLGMFIGKCITYLVFEMGFSGVRRWLIYKIKGPAPPKPLWIYVPPKRDSGPVEYDSDASNCTEVKSQCRTIKTADKLLTDADKRE